MALLHIPIRGAKSGYEWMLVNKAAALKASAKKDAKKADKSAEKAAVAGGAAEGVPNMGDISKGLNTLANIGRYAVRGGGSWAAVVAAPDPQPPPKRGIRCRSPRVVRNIGVAAEAKARKKEKALPEPKREEVVEPPPQAWAGPEDGVRRRMEKILGDLALPVEEQAGFSLKYVVEGQEEELHEALRLWEEAAEAYKEHRMAKIKGEIDEELADKRQRCLDAADAMMAIGDVASFKGQPFTKIFAT